MNTTEKNPLTVMDKIKEFLEKHVQEDKQYKAATLYEAFTEENGKGIISQKDFAMYLRLQVIRDDGILKRSSHGVYEMRTNPMDKGLSFPRQKSALDELTLENDPLLDNIYIKDGEVDLNKVFDDLRVLTVQFKKALDDIEKQVHTHEGHTTVRHLRKSMMKELDELLTGATALMAFQEDLTDDRYKSEWYKVCEAYCKKVGAELLFVNEGDFGCEMPDGEFAHIYADELQAILEVEDNQHSLKLT